MKNRQTRRAEKFLKTDRPTHVTDAQREKFKPLLQEHHRVTAMIASRAVAISTAQQEISQLITQLGQIDHALRERGKALVDSLDLPEGTVIDLNEWVFVNPLRPDVTAFASGEEVRTSG